MDIGTSSKASDGRHGIIAAVGCFLLLALLASRAFSAEPQSGAELRQWLQGYTTALVEAHGLIGASTAVTLPDGTTLRASAGVADVESGAPLNTTDRLLGGSTGKTYAATLAMMLAAKGELDLGAKVEYYLSDYSWYQEVPNATTITVQTLLNHSSGIPHYIDDMGFQWRFTVDRLIGNDTAYSPEQMLGFVLGEPALFEAGAGHYYSDLNYFLLGLVIEKVASEAYYPLLQEHILDYLQLTDTLPSNQRRIDRLAQGYAADTLINRLAGIAGASQVNGELKADPGIEWTGGGLATTPGDLARFYFHLGQGSLPGIDGISDLSRHSVSTAPGGSTRYGNGVFISDRPELGKYFSHSGWYPGYSSNVAYFVDHRFSIAIQINQDSEVDIYTPLREMATQLIPLLAAAPPEALEYSVLAAGSRIGSQSITRDENNSVDISYQFATQGKQPYLNINMSLDKDGLPIRMRRHGKAYLYHDIDESFEINAGKATWHSRLESGESTDYGNRYYVAYDLLNDGASAPAETALLAATALRRAGGRLGLLPSGSGHAEVIGWISLENPDTRATLDLQLVELTGLGLSPNYLWLDAAGNSFAEHLGGSVIRVGWESTISQMIEFQTKAVEARNHARHATLLASAIDSRMQPIVITNVNIFDQGIDGFHDGQTVVMEQGRISAVGPSADVTSPSGAFLIDGTDRFLIPGLWDMHVHLARPDLIKHLAAGVTMVRDMGNAPDELDRMHKEVASGALVGPGILRAGFIDQAGPLETPMGILVDDLDGALVAVDEYAGRGYQQIKLYGAIAPEWVEPIAKRTHELGMRLSGHIPMTGTTEQAIRSGYDEVQHFIYMWLNFADHPITSELTFNTARIARNTPADSADIRGLEQLFLDQDAALDPTLTIYSELLASKPGELKRSYRAMSERLPLQTARAARSGPLLAPEGIEKGDMNELFVQALQVVGDMHASGVDILVGTDHHALPGVALHTELELLSEAGISNADVIELATGNAARIMGLDKDYGSITPGKYADLLLLRDNPVTDIAATRSIELVVRQGVVYSAEQFDAAR